MHFVAPKLSRRLLAGFLACAVLAAVSASVGVMSLRQIENNLHDAQARISAPAEGVGKETERALQSCAALAGRRLNLQIWMSAGAFLLLALVGILATRSVTTPLGLVVKNLRDIAEGEGDLAKRIEATSHDEVGELAHWFNTFVAKLRKIIGDVAQNAMSISGSFEKFSAVSMRMASQVERMATQSNAAAAAGEQLSANINTTAVGCEEMSASVDSVAAAVEEMSSSLGEVAKSCEKESSIADQANNEVKATREVMDKLGKSAAEINKVIDVISGIAARTNLLALNAAIEAAGAGEAGKGFAVVANEVKDLARQSGQAAKQIAERIKNMRESVEGATAAIGSIAVIIEDVSRISATIAAAVEEQSSATNEIARSIGAASRAAVHIAGNMQQAAQAANEAATNIHGVSRGVAETASDVKDANANAQDSARLAANLRRIVAQFKT